MRKWLANKEGHAELAESLVEKKEEKVEEVIEISKLEAVEA